MAVAAPVIVEAMRQWTGLGGRNSGIVGDDGHTSGFHRAANEVGPDDYSRRRDPNGSDGPYTSWSYACAGDFWHGDDPTLLAYHRRLLARLEAGDPDLSMICEFIGQPWPDRPVVYWSRWGGRSTYRGAGHGTWSHVSWYRSRADRRAPLWQPEVDPMTTFTASHAATLDQLARVLPTLVAQSGYIDGRVEAIANGRPTVREDLKGGGSPVWLVQHLTTAQPDLARLADVLDVLVAQMDALAQRPATIDYDRLADAIVRRVLTPPAPATALDAGAVQG